MKGDVLSSLYECYTLNFGYLMEPFSKHLLMSMYGVLSTCIIGIPIGTLITRHSKIAWPVITIASIVQTMPATAMLAILMLALGLGPSTVVSTVFLYALLPIVKNTYADITEVDYNIKDTGEGIEMANNQITRMIELPPSLSVITGGICTALVVVTGIAATGSFIGTSTLGDIIIYETNSTDGIVPILAGAIPVTLTAILIDIGLRLSEKKLDPTYRSSK